MWGKLLFIILFSFSFVGSASPWACNSSDHSIEQEQSPCHETAHHDKQVKQLKHDCMDCSFGDCCHQAEKSQELSAVTLEKSSKKKKITVTVSQSFKLRTIARIPIAASQAPLKFPRPPDNWQALYSIFLN